MKKILGLSFLFWFLSGHAFAAIPEGVYTGYAMQSCVVDAGYSCLPSPRSFALNLTIEKGNALFNVIEAGSTDYRKWSVKLDNCDETSCHFKVECGDEYVLSIDNNEISFNIVTRKLQWMGKWVEVVSTFMGKVQPPL